MYSMTGYGFSEDFCEDFQISVELKSLNNRFLDINIKLPYVLNNYDVVIRNIVKKYHKRGKIDVIINLKELKHNFEITPDLLLADRYYETYKTILEHLGKRGFKDYIRLYNILTAEGVITVDEKTDSVKIWNSLETLLIEALKQLSESKLKEGEQTKQDLKNILLEMENNLKNIEQYSEESIKLYEEKLKKKIYELINEKNLDEERVLQEVAVISTKVDINEELKRLESHIKLFNQSLNEEDTVGRKLDFISQEMHREINTIGSKSLHIEVSNLIINLKTILEKLKEQIRNVE